jgi:tripartite-type tricarboxylate transporter receptor subunit TctC
VNPTTTGRAITRLWRNAVASRVIQEKLRAAGVEPKLSTPADVMQLLEAEIDQWARIIKSANIQIRE